MHLRLSREISGQRKKKHRARKNEYENVKRRRERKKESIDQEIRVFFLNFKIDFDNCRWEFV